jgi:hypothetical protein
MKKPGVLATRLAMAVTLSLVMGVILAGCGSGSPLAPRPVSVVVFQYQAQFSDLARFHVFVADFSVPESGTLDITVDWTSSTNDLDLVLSNPACDTTALAAGLCKVFASDSSNVKPARIRIATTATAYRLIVVNRGPGPETGTVDVKVTQVRLMS